MPKVSTDLRDQLVADRKSGMTVRAMAEKHGMNRTTVIKYTKGAAEMEARASEFVAGAVPTAPVPTVVANFFKQMEAPVTAVADVPRKDPQDVIQRILMNAETFPDVFPTVPDVSGKSVVELEGMLATMEQTRAVKLLTAQMKQVFLVGCRATEVLGKAFLRLRTDGMTDALVAQQAELDYLFRELAIKHAPRVGGTTSPEVRLLMLFGITVLQTDAGNRLKERVAKATPAETSEKYADL